MWLSETSAANRRHRDTEDGMGKIAMHWLVMHKVYADDILVKNMMLFMTILRNWRKARRQVVLAMSNTIVLNMVSEKEAPLSKATEIRCPFRLAKSYHACQSFKLLHSCTRGYCTT